MVIKRSSDNCGIDKLPDDILISILSHMSIIESGRASVLARRWRYLCRSAHETLRFDYRDIATGKVMERKKFESWVNNVMELHQAQHIEGMVIRLEDKRDQCWISPITYDNWVFFAIQKEVQRFELNLPFHEAYKFPSIKRLISHSHGVSAPLCRLRILRLARVFITDEMVHYFLASCPNLEVLCIRSCYSLKFLRVIDPPRLRVLEISRCRGLKSVTISAVDLVSLTYRGRREKLLLEKIPNLRELTICNGFCISFVIEPKEHCSYSVQLEKLVLDFRLVNSNRLEVLPPDLPQLCSLKRLEVFVVAGGTLLVFTPLIKASPQLQEFRIERMSYPAHSKNPGNKSIPFRGTKAGAKAMEFVVHRNLKVVEIGGYAGCQDEEELALALITIGPSIERVVLDTKTDYFGLESYIALRRAEERWHSTAVCRRPRSKTTIRHRAKERAKHFATKILQPIKFIVT